MRRIVKIMVIGLLAIAINTVVFSNDTVNKLATTQASNAETTTGTTVNDSKRTIEDGVYIIRSAINQKFVLDVLAASQDNGANVQLYEYTDVGQKKYKVTYLGDGYYTIVATHSNKALEVQDGLKNKGANVRQWEQKDIDAQKWLIKDVGNGYYSIISKCNGLYVDVLNASATNYTNIQMCDGNGLNAQKFKFEKVESSSNTSNIGSGNTNTTSNTVTGKQTIADGVYIIRSAINQKFVLDVLAASQDNGANVQLYEYTDVGQKKYKVTYLGDGYYTIIATHSNKALEVQDGLKNKGANVRQWEQKDIDAQKWVIKDVGNGYYSIISKCNGLYVDVLNASATNYTNIQMCDGNGLNAQKFKFEKVSDSTTTNTSNSSTGSTNASNSGSSTTSSNTSTNTGKQTIEDGTYVIMSAINQKYVLDVDGASKDNGANVQLYEYTDVSQKKYKVTYIGDGYYSIIATHSNKSLDVKYAGKTKGTNVWQYDSNGSDAQKWIIKDAGNGYYNIISKCNGLYVDVLNASATNYTNIQMCDGNGLAAQKFMFKKAEDVMYSDGTYGKSGLAVKGDSRGSQLRYYKFGNGSNVLFTTFSIHGFEDSYAHDGSELTYIAEEFKTYLFNLNNSDLLKKWTIYILPSVNPDGQLYGTTNNGEGRTTLYSSAPKNKGIDMNRCFQSTGETYTRYTDTRNYNGTESFQAYEAKYLRDFLLSKKSTTGQTLLIDLHGWLNETIGDDGLGAFYRTQFGMSNNISSYGKGYLVNWARQSLGNSSKVARSALIELPQVSNHSQVVSGNYAQKYINATINMLKSI